MDRKRYVYAVRIFGHIPPMAQLALGRGGRPTGETVTIKWNDPSEKEKYVIDGWTFVFDERKPEGAKSFSQYLERAVYRPK